MPYIIRNTLGEVVTVVSDGSLDQTTGIYLVGRSYVGYGEYISENFIRMMENFSNTRPPKNPLEGQIWYDLSSKLLKVWKKTSGIGSWITLETQQLSDLNDVSNVAPVIGQTLVWEGNAWTPGTILGGVAKIIAGDNISISPTNGLGNVTISSTSLGNGTANGFDFGNFKKTLTTPIPYLLDAVGIDFGTFINPAELSMDLNNLYIGGGSGGGGSGGGGSGGGYTGSAGADGVVGYTGSAGADGVVGYTGSAGADGVIGYTGSAGADGVIGYTGSAGFTQNSNISVNSLTVSGFFSAGSSNETVVVITGSTGSVTHDLLLGSTFYHTNVVGTFDVDLINVPLDQNKVTVVSICIDQGPNFEQIGQFKINGALQTVKWAAGLLPTYHSSQVDVISFSMFNINGVWSVFGQNGYFG
jgi:hypothetical protein